MPKDVPRQRSRRVLIDPRQSFDVTTPDLQVTARPTDPFFPQGGGDQAAQLAQAFGAISEGAAAGLGIFNRVRERAFQEGVTAQQAGEERPKSQLMAAGWDFQNGRHAARVLYKQEVMQFFEQNAETMDALSFSQGLKEISQKHLNGASEDFIKGFAPEAAAIEEQMATAYQQAVNRRIREDALDKASQIAHDEVQTVIQNQLAEIFDITDLDQIPGNTTIYDAFSKGDFGSVFAKDIRQALQTAIDTGKTLGIHPNDIEALYLDIVGQMAIQYGMPELLSFTEIKGKNGVSIAEGRLSQKVIQYRERAEEARASYIQARDRELEKALQENRNRALNELRIKISQIATNDSPMQRSRLAQGVFNQIASNEEFKNLPEDDLSPILNDLVDLINDTPLWPDESDPETYADLLVAAANGDVTLESIEAARRSGLLAKADYDRLINAWQTNEEQRQNAGGSTSWPDRSDIMSMEELMVNHISGGLNPFGLPEDQGLAANAKARFALARNQFKERHGRQPTFTEYMTQIAPAVFQDFQKDIRQMFAQKTSIFNLDQATAATVTQQTNIKTKFQDLSDLLAPPPPLPPMGGLIIGAEEGVRNISITFAHGGTKEQITDKLNELGLTDQEIKYHFDNYAYQTAYTILANLTNRNEARTKIHNTLLQFGYTPEEIEQAITAAEANL